MVELFFYVVNCLDYGDFGLLVVVVYVDVEGVGVGLE